MQNRGKFGKAVKTLRREGLIPAELYGRGIKNMHLAVDAKVFAEVLREAGESGIVTLLVGGEKKPVLVHDVSKNYLTGEVAHIDFYEVRMDEKIKTHIPIEFLGEAPAVREKGGFLNKTLTEVEVEALPGDLPHNLTVNLDSLDDFRKSIYVKDIAAPAGVTILVHGSTVVATAMPPLKEEIPEVPAPADVSAVKVEDEEKKAERAVEKSKKGEKAAQ